MNKITIVLVIIALALAAAAAAYGGIEHGRVAGQARQISQEQRAEARLAREVRTVQMNYGNLQSKVASISQPTDPLSAYDDICNQQMQNSNTGSEQTYYFPCTNNAETIPEPGQ
jgi:type II secretory pathway pseudopilin PulG